MYPNITQTTGIWSGSDGTPLFLAVNIKKVCDDPWVHYKTRTSGRAVGPGR